MRFIYSTFFFLFITFSFAQKQNPSIGFIENKGQIIDQKGKQNKDVLYLLNTSGLNVQLRSNGFSYDVYETKKVPLTQKDKSFTDLNTQFTKKKTTPDYSFEYHYHRIDIDFEHSNPAVKLLVEGKSSDYDNYYNVAHAPEGITGVHKYKKVTYQNIYNHIDVTFFIPKDTTKAVEYNFIVKPGGKVSDIQMKFNGAETELKDNKIKMNVRFGQMEETLPLSWIENGNSRKEIMVGYTKIKNNVYGFGGDVNASNKTIVIDPAPVRLWGTFYGGTEEESRFHSTVKSFKDYIYLVGYTLSSNTISTAGSYQNSISTVSDAFITKFNPDGERVWGTYYGGNHDDSFKNLTLDSNENIYCVGMTGSPANISSTNSHQEDYVDWYDGMLIKFNSNGYRIWGTYYGGQKVDDISSVTIDTNNNLYIAGYSHSLENISTPNSFKPTMEVTTYTNQMNDGFLAKFDLDGKRIWSTYYGGIGGDHFTSLDTDSQGNIFCSGITNSRDQIATSGAFHTSLSENQYWIGWQDSFIVKFTPNGERVFGTYYGGYDYDYSDCIKIDKLDNVIISGSTRSWNEIGTPGSHQPVNGGGNAGYTWDSYLAKFNNNGQLLWSTYYGGEEQDGNNNNAVDIDENNNIFFISSGESNNNIATPNAYDSVNDNIKVYLVKFDSNGHRIWGTYFGNNLTFSGSISYDKNGIFYISGWTYASTDISTSGSHQANFGGNTDAFLVKFKDCLSSQVVSSNSPICIGKNLQLNASGGANYSWTGPNGFTSTDQNPIITNANATHSGQYTCAITGTGDCDNTLTVNVLVGDATAPVPNIANLTAITGDCNTVVSTVPTATDNCAGLLNGTTSDPLTYTIPGNYIIHWNYNDGNGNTSTQNQNVTITAIAIPTLNSPQDFCIQENATLSDISIIGQNIKWYDAQTGGNLLPINTLLQNGVTYYATQTINSCESVRVPVTANMQNTPAPTGNATQSFCSTQNATLNTIAITGTDVKWYSNSIGANVLPITTPLANNITYYATQTLNGCESVNRTPVTIQLINTLNATDFSDYLCDDLNNGHEKIDLTSYNSSMLSNLAGNTFNYYKSFDGAQDQTPREKINNEKDYQLNVGTSTIYVRIDNTNTCSQIVKLNLTLYSKPIIPIAEVTPICQGSTITINAGTFDKYQWSTGENTPSIIVTEAGKYSVTVTENHIGINCTATKDFKVVNSNNATIQNIVISDWSDNNNSISIVVTNGSIGDYEYSIDGIIYQNNNTFNNLPTGEYTIYVRDKNGCGTAKDLVYLISYSKFFTPNNDGHNDFWKINFSNNEPNLIIQIYDRYGKLLKTLNNDTQSWDGTHLGQPLPADDYWFTVIRANGKEYKEHFTLKR